MEVIMKQNLSNEEIVFFYNLLFRYEHETLAGYKDDDVMRVIGSKIVIDDNHTDDEILSYVKDNCIQYAYRKNKCRAILRHIRNAFAHGNIQSTEKYSVFIMKDYDDPSKRKKCNMLAKVNKGYFYELIDAMESTRKKPSQKINSKPQNNDKR